MREHLASAERLAEELRSPVLRVWTAEVSIEYATRTGSGMQIPVADLDGDGDLDFAVAGKSGVYLFENLTKTKGKRR